MNLGIHRAGCSLGGMFCFYQLGWYRTAHDRELWKKKVDVVQRTLLILTNVLEFPRTNVLCFGGNCLDFFFVRFCVLSGFRHSWLPFTVGRHCDSCPVLQNCAVYNLVFVPENWEILLGITFRLVDDCLGQQNLISSSYGVQQARNCLLKCMSSPTHGKLAKDSCCHLLMPFEEVPLFGLRSV